MASVEYVRGCSGFDRAITLERLCDDPTLLAEVAPTYIDTTLQQLQAIREALAARDLVRVSREAHSLKGATSIFEAPAALASIVELERAAKSGGPNDIAVLACRADALVRDLIAQLQDPEVTQPQHPE